MAPVVSVGTTSLCSLKPPCPEKILPFRFCAAPARTLSSVQIVLRNSGAPVIRDLVDYGLEVVTAVGSSGALGSGAPAPVGGNSPKYSATERSK